MDRQGTITMIMPLQEIIEMRISFLRSNGQFAELSKTEKCYVSIRPKKQTKRNISMQHKKNYPDAAQHDKNDTMINCRPHLGGRYWSIEGGMYYTTIKYAPLHQTVLGEASSLSLLSTDEYSCSVL